MDCAKTVKQEVLEETKSEESAAPIGLFRIIKQRNTDKKNDTEFEEVRQLATVSGQYVSCVKDEPISDIEIKDETMAPKAKRNKQNNKKIIFKKPTQSNKECEQCHRIFVSQTALFRHSKSHLEKIKKTHLCRHCGKKCNSPAGLIRHEATHTGLKTFMCQDCGNWYADEITLTRHLRTHSGEKPFICYECGRCFSTGSSLVRHIRVHTGEKPHSCSECGKAFIQIGALKLHVNKHHRGSIIHSAPLVKPALKDYKCTVCSKTFTTENRLNNHLRVHSDQDRGEKEKKKEMHHCTQCGLGFPRKSLSRHMLLHIDTKPHSCDICGRGFRQIGNMKAHRMIHTGEKRYTCEECGRGFIQHTSYKIHVKRHS